MALGIVQVVHHAGVGGKSEQKVVEFPHSLLAEDIYHQTHLLTTVNLAMACTEDHVPEKGYFLLELPRAVDHAPDPLLHIVLDSGSFVIRRVVADEQIFLDGLLALGVEQLFYHIVITLGCLSLDLIAARTETGATQEVGHQGNILFSHVFLLTGECRIWFVLEQRSHP